MKPRSKYDVIIIGAGLGGLVCGCYLAKAGMKVLIVEKNSKAGGYCTSFDKDGFRFDLGVHSLGSLRPGGILNRIFADIGVLDRLNLIRTDPTNTVIMPDLEFNFFCDKKKTIEDFKKTFPKDIDDINNFFNLVFDTKIQVLFPVYRKCSLKDLLNEIFKNYKIKCLINALLGNGGLPSRYISAFSALLMLREFIFDGGYHIKSGGMQVLSDALVETLEAFGGHIIYGTEITRIYTKNDRAVSVGFKEGRIDCRYTVSASDAYRTVYHLIGKEKYDKITAKKIKKLIPTPSAVLFFLGFQKEKADFFKTHCSTWFCPNYYIDRYYPKPFSSDENFTKKSILVSSPTAYDESLAPRDGGIAIGLLNFNYKPKLYWQKNGSRIKAHILKSIHKFSGLGKESIITESFLTPDDLAELTYNYKGAMRGWASTPEQNLRSAFPHRSMFKNLFFVGHWTTTDFGQGGLSNVTNTACRVYEEIRREEELRCA